MYMYIERDVYIYIYIYIERERDIHIYRIYTYIVISKSSVCLKSSTAKKKEAPPQRSLIVHRVG